MNITANKIVTIDYTLKDDAGNVLDSSDGHEALAYMHGANNIIIGLEKALEGKVAGDTISVVVSPDEGYGIRDESRVTTVAKDMFAEAGEIEVGMQYHAASPDGEAIVVTVVEMDADNVTIDGNHPLAGENLNFEVKIIDVRDATAEEIEHGHAHGPDGHHHH